MPFQPILLVLSAFPASAQGAVHVVDAANGPGAEFTSLAEAVAAAASGDLVLVREGDYVEAIELPGKSLTIVADAGASVRLSHARVYDLTADGVVLMRGLALDYFGSNVNLAAHVLRNEGPVWFEDCDLLAGTPFSVFHSTGALFADDCATVVVARCLLERPIGPTTVSTIQGTSSRLHVFDTESRGTAPDAAAILVYGGFLELFGSTAAGGDGASGSGNFFPLLCNGQAGGDGLSVAQSTALILDSALSGGAGGAPFGTCSPGLDGEPLVVSSGSASFLAGNAHGYEVSCPVRDDGVVAATVGGSPGDLVWIAYGTQPGPGLGSRLWDGELLVAAPQLQFVGTVPASGLLALAAPAPTLPAGVESRVFYSQAFVRSASTGRFVVSSPSALVVVDDAF